MGFDAVDSSHRHARRVRRYRLAQVDKIPVGPHHPAPAGEGADHFGRHRRHIPQLGSFLIGIDMVQMRRQVNHSGVLQGAKAGPHQAHGPLHHNFGFGAGRIFLVKIPVGDDVRYIVERQAEGLAGVNARLVQAAVLNPDQPFQAGDGGELLGGFGPAGVLFGDVGVALIRPSPPENAHHCGAPPAAVPGRRRPAAAAPKCWPSFYHHIVALDSVPGRRHIPIARNRNRAPPATRTPERRRRRDRPDARKAEPAGNASLLW